MTRWMISLLMVCASFGAQLQQRALAEHGMGMGYEPKYKAGFTHFDYLNPSAPKGGSLTLSAQGTFNKFNPFTLKGQIVAGMGWSSNGFVFAEASLLFDSLTAQSEDEPFSRYGLIAKDMVLAKDKLSVTFTVDELAKFSNGDAVLAKDVKHSFETLMSKQAMPTFRTYWADVKSVTVVSERVIRFDFKRTNSELHMVLGQLPIFSHKWPDKKLLDAEVMTPPITSGPYTIKDFALGKFVRYERNKNYWAKDHPARRGMYNFDHVTYQYYADPVAEMEAIKAGEIDVKDEASVLSWMRRYKGKRFDSGEITKAEYPHHRLTGMQGLVFNTRREKFQDIRVRKALILAFDFEYLNRKVFYGKRKRTNSFFTNTEDLMARPVMDEDERAVWQKLRSPKPVDLDAPLQPPPSTAAPHSLRENLRQAQQLLKEAGWTYKDGALRNAKNEPYTIEFLYASAAQEPILSPFAQSLEKLGITFKYRRTDAAIIQKREAEFDFDMTVGMLGGSSSPGNELYDDFSSKSANEKGSQNLIGIADPLIDELIDVVVQAPNRKALSAAARAFDRTMRKKHVLIPMYYSGQYFIASKQGFGHTEKVPDHSLASLWVLTMWWRQ